jgi:uncharacterized protein (TIGR02147 family)
VESNTSKISIFDYTDYRKYLSDFYKNQKQKTKYFSYRYFAKKTGINSTGLYKDVVEGRQHIGKALIFKFSTAFGHSKKEAEYFENMVYFNDAKTVEERKLFFARMLACQGPKAKIVEVSKYEYYSKWYYSAIRALLSCGQFRNVPEDHKKISKTLEPQIRPDQAKKAVAILEKLGFINKNEAGFFVVVDSAITTGSVKPDKNVAALNIINFQKEMLKLAAGAFDRFPSAQSNMSTLTIGISSATLANIKEELSALRGKIAVIAENERAADRIYQFNMQLFPISNTYEKISKI